MMQRACRPTSMGSPETSLMVVTGLASPPSPGMPRRDLAQAAGALFLRSGGREVRNSAGAQIAVGHTANAANVPQCETHFLRSKSRTVQGEQF